MLKVIGKDGKEYGPVSDAELRRWLGQRRLDATSRVRRETDSAWRTLGEFAEFAQDLGLPTGAAAAVPPLAIAPPKVSGLAIASLILGLLGFVTVGVASLPGLVLGIVALIKVRKDPSRLAGSGLAIAGICVSGFTLLLLPLMAALLLPALATAKSKAQTIQCITRVKQLNLALIMYATDHEETLPPADKWCDMVVPYLGKSMATFHCPAEPGDGCSYSFNAALSNQKLPKPNRASKTVLVFSSADGWNRSAGEDQLAPHRHEGRMCTVGFADGRVEVARSDPIHAWIWKP
jgi:prepilin-type processing-associated H-X9-DG protein